MQEKPKRKRKGKMSRRQFLQIGMTASALGIGACVSTQWTELLANPTPTIDPTALANANCGYTWGPNTTRVNEVNTALLQEALLADGLNPTYVEVYDRAMEYVFCEDSEGNLLSNELLYRYNEGAIVAFAIETPRLSESIFVPVIQAVLDTLEGIDAFNVQDLSVQIGNDEDSYVWKSSVYMARNAESDNALYLMGFAP